MGLVTDIGARVCHGEESPRADIFGRYTSVSINRRHVLLLNKMRARLGLAAVSPRSAVAACDEVGASCGCRILPYSNRAIRNVT